MNFFQDYGFVNEGMSCLQQDMLGQAFEDAFEVMQQHSDGGLQYSADYKSYLTFINHYPHVRANPNCFGTPLAEEPGYNWRTIINSATDFYFEGNFHHSPQNISENQVIHPVSQQKGGRGRKKLRLFEYLYESLSDPEMAECIQWVDQPRGVFQFVSKNKEKLAELWGKKKGNRKTMTYQKMARALRNYGRTGEIIKIRRKLTYQFSDVVLQRLSPPYFLGKEIIYTPCIPSDQEYINLNNWTCNYSYMNNSDLELNHADN
uniref:Transcription factor Spi-C n=2 Tax=Ornithorhynchus anatinus TaxID=9258 RepID=A0A6I8N723_ORNAN